MAYLETTHIADAEHQIINPSVEETQQFQKLLLHLLQPLALVGSATGRVQIEIPGTVSVNANVTNPTTSIVAFGLTPFELQVIAGRSGYSNVVRSVLTF